MINEKQDETEQSQAELAAEVQKFRDETLKEIEQVVANKKDGWELKALGLSVNANILNVNVVINLLNSILIRLDTVEQRVVELEKHEI